jgi:hypothetical protein
MFKPARRPYLSIARLIALAAAALAEGALAGESVPDDRLLRVPAVSPEVHLGGSTTMPSFLDPTRLPKVEEAYRTRAGEAGAEQSSMERAPADIEPHPASDMARRFTETEDEGAARVDGSPPAKEPVEASRDRDAHDAGGWIMHAGDGATHAGDIGRTTLQARVETGEARGEEADRRSTPAVAPRRNAEPAATAAATDPPPAPVRARRSREREKQDRRGEDAPKDNARESRREARPQAERSGGGRRGTRDSERRAAVADDRKPRPNGRAEPAPGRMPPPPPEIEPPPPPPRSRLFGLFSFFGPSDPEPPMLEPARPVIPDQVRPHGSYMR